MLRALLLCCLLGAWGQSCNRACSQAWCQVSGGLPDGTLVFSSKPGSLVGGVANRMATRSQGFRAESTHVGVIIGGRVYHSDYPRVGTVRVGVLKRGEVARYVVPAVPFSRVEVEAMRRHASSRIGERYRLRGFLRPDGVTGGYCSPFVRDVLRAGGMRLSYRDGFTPDLLMRAVIREGRYGK